MAKNRHAKKADQIPLAQARHFPPLRHYPAAQGAARPTAEPIPLPDFSQRLAEVDPRLLLEAIEPSVFPSGIRQELVARLEPLDPDLAAEIQAQRDTLVATLLDRLAAGMPGESPSLTMLRSILLPRQPSGLEPAR